MKEQIKSNSISLFSTQKFVLRNRLFIFIKMVLHGLFRHGIIAYAMCTSSKNLKENGCIKKKLISIKIEVA